MPLTTNSFHENPSKLDKLQEFENYTHFIGRIAVRSGQIHVDSLVLFFIIVNRTILKANRKQFTCEYIGKFSERGMV